MIHSYMIKWEYIEKWVRIKYMDREKFDSLLIQEQINYLNSKIEEGISLSKICKDIGIAKSTVATRIKKHGYVSNKEGFYVLSKSDGETQLEDYHDNIKENNKTASKPSEMDLLIKRVETIEKQLKQFKIDSEANKKQTNDNKEFIPTEFNSDIKQITARLNTEVYKKLNKMYEEHKLISRQVILNTLLNEVLDKYLK